MKKLSTIQRLVFITLTIALAVAVLLLSASDSRATSGPHRNAMGDIEAMASTFPTDEEIVGFVDNLDAERFLISSDLERTMTGSAEFTDGLIIAESPGFWRWLGKAVIVAGTTIAGSVISPGLGTAVGAHTGVIIVELCNAQPAYSPAVVDVGLFEVIDVPTLGDIAPIAVSMVLDNVTSSFVLDQWNDKIPGTFYTISFTKIFSGRVVDSEGLEKPGTSAIAFVLSEEHSGQSVFGVAYFNPLGNVTFSDRFDVDFGSLIPDSLHGSLVSYRAGGLIAFPESAATACAIPIGGILELLVDGSDSPASAAEASGSSSPPYAAIAGAAAAAALALTAGGWYARRRLS